MLPAWGCGSAADYECIFVLMCANMSISTNGCVQSKDMSTYTRDREACLQSNPRCILNGQEVSSPDADLESLSTSYRYLQFTW